MTASDVQQARPDDTGSGGQATQPGARPSADGVLDLRPPQESLRAELCRLGFEYSSADHTGEPWRAYQRGVLGTFD